MLPSTFLLLIGLSSGAVIALAGVVYALRTRARVRLLIKQILSSPLVWAFQDLIVMCQCLLASLSLYLSIPDSSGCDPNIWKPFRNQTTISWPTGQTLEDACQPRVASLASARHMLLCVIIISQLIFGAAVVLRATGALRQHATVLFFTVCSSALVLACCKIAIVVFLVVRTVSYDLQFSCDDSGLIECGDKNVVYNISNVYAHEECLTDCIANIFCRDQCHYPKLQAEVYFLMFNFLISFCYICYLMVEYRSGKVHLSVWDEPVYPEGPASHEVNRPTCTATEHHEVKARRVHYRRVRNTSALAKVLMALSSLAAILYSSSALFSCEELSCEGPQGQTYVTKAGDIEDSCYPVIGSSTSVYQFQFAVASVMLTGVFVAGNTLSMRVPFAHYGQAVAVTVALLQLSTIAMLLWTVSMICDQHIYFRRQVTVDITSPVVYFGLSVHKMFESSDGGVCGSHSCRDYCKVRIPSSVTYLLGVLATSFWFMVVNLFEYKQLALLKNPSQKDTSPIVEGADITVDDNPLELAFTSSSSGLNETLFSEAQHTLE